MNLMPGPGLSGDAAFAPVGSSSVYTYLTRSVPPIFNIWFGMGLRHPLASGQNTGGDSC